jgi:AcrR family transcriptional regulator
MGIRKKSLPGPDTESVEDIVLAFAWTRPQYGQAKVAEEVRLLGHEISPTRVRNIWKRHGLETAYKRLSVLRKMEGGAARELTGNQLALLRRGDVVRRLSKRVAGARADNAASIPDERQEQILKAAAALFVKQGYAGTSIRDIGNQVGLLAGSVYHHFPSKEDLFVAIHREGFRQLVARIEDALARHKDPWERLEAACAVHIASAVAGNAIDKITAIGLFAIHEGKLQKRLERDRKAYDRKLRTLVDDLGLPTSRNRSIFRLALLGALNWTITWYKPGKLDPDGIANALRETFRGRPVR